MDEKVEALAIEHQLRHRGARPGRRIVIDMRVVAVDFDRLGRWSRHCRISTLSTELEERGASFATASSGPGKLTLELRKTPHPKSIWKSRLNRLRALLCELGRRLS